jgi:hypothetical protein
MRMKLFRYDRVVQGMEKRECKKLAVLDYIEAGKKFNYKFISEGRG